MAIGLTFSELIDSVSNSDEQDVIITENWMQGRTTYGGLSASLCLKAAVNLQSNLPPLRSAQVSFIGPVGSNISLRARILRQGRSVTFIAIDLIADERIAVNCVFSFAKSRNSKLNHVFIKKPDFRPDGNCEAFLDNHLAPAFTRNFECKLASGAQPVSSSSINEHYLWVRHKGYPGNDLCALVALADMAPPAVMSMFKELVPVSSMTWMFNIVSEKIETEDGWWLLRTAAEHAQDGYSSQDMQMWNTNGELVLSGRQNVAIFY